MFLLVLRAACVNIAKDEAMTTVFLGESARLRVFHSHSKFSLRQAAQSTSPLRSSVPGHRLRLRRQVIHPPLDRGAYRLCLGTPFTKWPRLSAMIER